uniref:NADH-ubiquinone oxidoreductase chain 6 n=1 Tax=Volvocales sp. NrCl902 TaxID=2682054 RepID=A0A7G1GGB3_9CHLO|nr:NADH dehydrogenase subunit 6 [Volvocales sp. NrCl902]
MSFILLCALLAFLIPWTRSPFMSLMYSVMLFINASIVLLMLGFEFLALVNILVYVGALAVLFLFVIMLLEIPSTELRAYARGWSVLALAGFLAARIFFFSPQPSFVNTTFTPTFESISYIGFAFYQNYADLIILNSLVLTIALFGALVLAHTRS